METILRITVPQINQNKIFYTDSNSLYMNKRKLNHRKYYQFTFLEPVTENYYPVNSAIFIEDGNLRATLMNDRSQGGSSLNPGEIEVLISRNWYVGDHKGLHEPFD